MSDHPTVAILGNGVMGGAIGARLLDRGVSVRAHDRNPPKRAALAAKGAVDCATPAEAGEGADVVLCSLNSAEAVRALTLGEEGALGTAAMVIDMSSIDPGATTALARDAAARGVAWVDAPLSGGAAKCATGSMTLMLGGEEAHCAEAEARVLRHLAANITRMGPSGAGQATKLVNQVLCGLHFVAAAEATALAQAAGVDAALIPRALAGGRADSAILQEFMPRMAARDYARTGRIDNMVKDLEGAHDLSRATGTAMPVTALVLEMHRMMTAWGWGGEDQAALMELFGGPDEARRPR